MGRPLMLVVPDPEGGYEVCDMRDGAPVAWRSAVEDAAAIASHLNACYPSGVPAPAYDSLVHEIAMTRIGGEPEMPLHVWASDQLNLCGLIPDGVDDRPALWKPVYDRGEG